MSAPENPKQSPPKKVTVPRDRDLDQVPPPGAKSPPAAADVNPRDEYYSDGDKPLVAGSAEAKALHDRPPKTKGTLGVGTAGDSARPTKPGIHTKAVPPRGKM